MRVRGEVLAQPRRGGRRCSRRRHRARGLRPLDGNASRRAGGAATETGRTDGAGGNSAAADAARADGAERRERRRRSAASGGRQRHCDGRLTGRRRRTAESGGAVLLEELWSNGIGVSMRNVLVQNERISLTLERRCLILRSRSSQLDAYGP